MVDPKMVELGVYNGIPHLLIPVVTDPKKAAGALQWAVTEMMRRYRVLAEASACAISTNITAKSPQMTTAARMPRIVVVIDELADLMLVAAKEVEESICRVAQMGRASRYAPDYCYAASLGGRHHRPDEGQYPVPHCLCRGVLTGVAYHSGYARRGKAGGQGRHALCAAGQRQAAACAGLLYHRRRSPERGRLSSRTANEAAYSTEVMDADRPPERGGRGAPRLRAEAPR